MEVSLSIGANLNRLTCRCFMSSWRLKLANSADSQANFLFTRFPSSSLSSSLVYSILSTASTFFSSSLVNPSSGSAFCRPNSFCRLKGRENQKRNDESPVKFTLFASLFVCLFLLSPWLEKQQGDYAMANPSMCTCVYVCRGQFTEVHCGSKYTYKMTLWE